MSWHVVVRPEVEGDMAEAMAWYEARRAGLGTEFREETIQLFDALAVNPLLNSRRHPRKNIRWRFLERFPYRIIYEAIERDETVVIAAVLHAARHDRHWKRRV
jgi:toxin ParE1/3/4